jgi:hypothetical protein
MPAGQLTQTVAPAAPEYFPAAHLAHTPALVAAMTFEYAPAVQFSHILAPAAPEYAPVGHETHALEPVTFLYWPAAHAEHCPPFGPVYPASQVQLVSDPLPAADTAFAWHGSHDDASLLPVAPENVLIGQGMHALAPVVLA